MKPSVMIGVACFVLVAWGVTSHLSYGAPGPRRQETQAFMRQKLTWSLATLEGITLEKFDLVSKNAIRMRNMTQSNQWFTVRQPDYMRYTTNFYQSIDALYLAAVDKKLDAATEAYVKVSRNCVECHRLVRTEQRKNMGQAPPAKVESLPIRP